MRRWLLVLGLLGLAVWGCVALPPAPLEPVSRGIATPAAPVVDSGRSAVTNVVCEGDCVPWGRTAEVTADLIVRWSHADPLTADYYEVWSAEDEPYFELGCVTCALAGTTTGLSYTVPDAPPAFQAINREDTTLIMSTIETVRVRAVNAGGASALSNEIGIVHFSLLMGSSNPPPLE